MADTLYPDTFFDFHEEGSRTSARETIPLVLEFIRPASVVDVGCGIGIWLAAFKAAGVSDCLGIDGDYVNRARLVIEPDRFLPRDLSRPLTVNRGFDLAISLEVAEHLPAEAADAFIASLVELAPVVLFSAAIPQQGGTGHVNEQWPEYWQAKFARHDYVVVDCLRERLWMNTSVKAWYAQNLLWFVRRDRLADYPRLASAFQQRGESPPLSRVHPQIYLGVTNGLHQAMRHAQSLALRAALKLRQINLLAFPDWSLPPERVLDQLRNLLRALLAHPQGSKVALVLDFGKERQELAGNLVGQANREVLMPGGAAIAGPSITAVGKSFGVEEWEVLLGCVQGRIILADEDVRAVVATGADRLATFDLAAIQDSQMLT